ncbi:type III-B CRISPR module-associated protein Cmr3 [Sphingobacteriales bacterium UPWRP_1]|nr:type III-B CRISPR module-associated protein Cmr3 [Sphingobacteriales bacterium UPWRP_1]
MELRIEPLDTLFFRDGKPFSMGEETWADSHLLPSPSVIYGMLRTAIATQNGIPFEDINDLLGKEVFSIIGIYYRANNQIVLPMPLDLVSYDKEAYIIKAENEAKEYEVKPLEIRKIENAIFSSIKSAIKSYLLVAKNLEQVDAIEDGMIISTELSKYLANEILTTKAIKLTDFLMKEPKIGIARDDMMRNADEGMLYRVDMKRPKEFQIGVVFHLTIPLNPNTILKLGGEGKTINLLATRIPTKIAAQNIVFNNRFKIYFATPAILLNGQPDLSKLGIEAKLVAACVGKPISLGGFDLKEKKAKQMYRVVPAGSVFYYETPNDVTILNDKQGTPLSDEQAEQGFGIAYFGTWNYINK